MSNEPDNDEPHFITPEQRAQAAETTNDALEAYFAQKLPQMLSASTQAAANQDADGLRKVAAGIGAFEAKLSQWNDACGSRASAKLIACVETMGQMRDDIQATLNGELPGQQTDDPAEKWKG